MAEQVKVKGGKGKVLKSFTFREFGRRTGEEHDWDTLLDGKIRQLEEGKDYHCKTATMRMAAFKAAKKRGLAVKSAKVEGGLVIQSYKPEPSENGEAHMENEGTEETQE